MDSTTNKKRGEYCPIQGHKRAYFATYDAFACLKCNAWLSNQCGCSEKGYNCGFKKMPRDPSMVKDCEPEYF